MSSIQRNLPPIRYRKKCQILAGIDLFWRVCDLFYAIVSIFFPKYGHKTREIPEDEVVLSYDVIKVLDPRIYDFLLSPFLTLIYFFGFFLQVSSSIFLCKSCNGKAIPENERAACRIWSRITVVSLVILCIRFFLPYVLLSFFYVTYNVVRVLFKVFGIYIVIKHGQEMEARLLYCEFPTNSEQVGGSTASCSHSDEIPIRLERSSSTRKKQYASNSSIREPKEDKHSKRFSARYNANQNNQFVRPRVHRAMLLVEKDVFEKALTELKIAQSYAPEDSNVAVLLKAVEKMDQIVNFQKKDYYKILGVSRTLSLSEIKKAFRRKSLRHHPDKHFTESDKVKTIETKLFQEIREAYEILSDPRKRAAYDDKMERDQEALLEYKKIFKSTYASFDSQYVSSIV